MLGETLLASLPGSHEHDRALVVLCAAAGKSHVELRQQSWGEGVGWYTQSTVTLEPSQIAGLRGVLGAGSPARSAAVAPTGFSPRVVRFESA
jgi:hypothetical protein